MNAPERNLFLIGAFPPPLHGMSAVNEAIRLAVASRDATHSVINLSGPNLNRSLWQRLRRLPVVLHGLLTLAFNRVGTTQTIYLSVSGGNGQLYDLLFVGVARIRGMRLFMHHHSFAYLDQISLITTALVFVAGPQATHIVLSKSMAHKLSALYGAATVYPISNSAVVNMGRHSIDVSRLSLQTIGYLGNISPEKGINEFLILSGLLHDTDSPVAAKVCGPFQDSDIKKTFTNRLRDLPNVEYVGPKYGLDKFTFLSDIDLLVFPSRYVNEAEPLVVLEAMSMGIPVIAYDRGALAEVVGSDGGLIVSEGSSLASIAKELIEIWLNDSREYNRISIAAKARFDQLAAENCMALDALLTSLVG